MSRSSDDDRAWMRVLDHNACRHCRRPITLIKNIGWLHGGLPKHAHETLTCEQPMPVDPRCPHCGELTPAIPVGSRDSVQLILHIPQGGQFPCNGSGATVVRPT